MGHKFIFVSMDSVENISIKMIKLMNFIQNSYQCEAQNAFASAHLTLSKLGINKYRIVLPKHNQQ